VSDRPFDTFGASARLQRIEDAELVNAVANIGAHAARVAYDVRWEPRWQPRARFSQLRSQPCTAEQCEELEYRAWCERLAVRPLHHRKQWEWCYILEALRQQGMLRAGHHGLGFGVGSEPIVAAIAALDARVTATDLPSDADAARHWASSGQHATHLGTLNAGLLCPPEAFARLVGFRPVDMNDVPSDLTGFDFCWSSCALEHLGSIEAGLRFVHRSLDCLRAGGVAVHTTEYNVSSGASTVEAGPTVAFRRADLRRLARELRRHGHHIRLTFRLGTSPDDRFVDHEPWSDAHLKLQLGPHVITSFGLLIRKGGGQQRWLGHRLPWR